MSFIRLELAIDKVGLILVSVFIYYPLKLNDFKLKEKNNIHNITFSSL